MKEKETKMSFKLYITFRKSPGIDVLLMAYSAHISSSTGVWNAPGGPRRALGEGKFGLSPSFNMYLTDRAEMEMF
jgi:hypothetical protein